MPQEPKPFVFDDDTTTADQLPETTLTSPFQFDSPEQGTDQSTKDAILSQIPIPGLPGGIGFDPFGVGFHGFLDAASLGAVSTAERLMGLEPAYHGPVQSIVHKAGEFVGFIGGTAVPIGKATLRGALSTKAGKAFFDWFGKTAGPKAANWLGEGIGLGIATAVSASEETAALIQDPSIEKLLADLHHRGVESLWGAAVGIRFGAIRDKIDSFALRAAFNLAITNGTMYVRNGMEAPPIEDIIFNSLLDVYFSKHKVTPDVKQQEQLKRFVNDTVIKAMHDGIVPYDIINKAVEKSRAEAGTVETLEQAAARAKAEVAAEKAEREARLAKDKERIEAAPRFEDIPPSVRKAERDLPSVLRSRSKDDIPLLGPRDTIETSDGFLKVIREFSVEDAINSVVVKQTTRPELRELGEAFLRIGIPAEVRGVAVEHIPSEPGTVTAAAYIPDLRFVAFGADAFVKGKQARSRIQSGRLGSQGADEIILHEVLHSYSAYAINQYITARRMGQADLLDSRVKKFGMNIEMNRRLALKHKSDLILSQGGVYAEPLSKYNVDYALSDMHEFVSGALTNRPFQRWLKGIEVETAPRRVSLWDRFLDAVTEFVTHDKPIKNTLLKKTIDDVVEFISGETEMVRGQGGERRMVLRSKTPEEKKAEGKFQLPIEKRQELAKVYAAGIAKRQGLIDNLIGLKEKTDEQRLQLSTLMREQVRSLEDLSQLTGRIWSYDPRLKEFKVGDKTDLVAGTQELYPSQPGDGTHFIERYKQSMAERQVSPIISEVTRPFLENVKFKDPPGEQIFKYMDYIFGPEFVLRKYPRAQRLAGKMIEGEMLIEHQVNNIDDVFFRDQAGKLKGVLHEKKMEKIKVKGAIKDLYDKQNAEATIARAKRGEEEVSPEELVMAKVKKKQVEAAEAANPERYQVARNIQNWFGEIREEIKDFKREMIQRTMDRDFFESFNKVLGEFGPIAERGTSESRAARIEEIGVEAGLPKKMRNTLKKLVDDYFGVDFWGVNDYITKIERGTWKVLDQDGHVRAVRLTGELAEEVASRMVKEGQIEKAEIVQEFSKVDPFKKRKGILEGEENIFDALKTYSYAVRKRMVVDPLVWEMEQEFANAPHRYPKNIREMIYRQLEAVKGRYYFADRYVDELFTALGSKGQPFRFSRATGKARGAEGKMKLGYRVVAGAVNMASGYHHIWTKTNGSAMLNAAKFMRTPEGKEFLRTQEPYIGISMSLFEGGARGHVKALHPLYLFAAPERHIRHMALAANYLLGQKAGLSREQAAIDARRAMRFQAFVYNASALPAWMRSPTGKLVGQFKAYMVQEIQFMAGLRGAEIGRYLGGMLLLGGPAAVLHVLQSLPLMEDLGLADKIQEYLLDLEIPEDVPVIGGGRPLYGVPGLLGFDVSISTALQFPNRIEEWLGPFLSDVMKQSGMIKDAAVLGPEEAYGIADFKDVDARSGKLEAFTSRAGDYIVQMKYINEILTTRFKTQPDGQIWVRDKQGRLSYPIDSEWDYMKLAFGAKPMAKTQYQNKLNILRRQKLKRRERARDLLRRAARKFNVDGTLGEDFERRFLDDMLEFGITDGQTIINAIKNRQLPPEVREIQSGTPLDKVKAIDIFYEELYRQHFELGQEEE